MNSAHQPQSILIVKVYREGNPHWKSVYVIPLPPEVIHLMNVSEEHAQAGVDEVLIPPPEYLQPQRKQRRRVPFSQTFQPVATSTPTSNNSSTQTTTTRNDPIIVRLTKVNGEVVFVVKKDANGRKKHVACNEAWKKWPHTVIKFYTSIADGTYNSSPAVSSSSVDK